MLTHMFYAPETKTCIPDNRNNFRFHEAFLLQTGYCRKSLYPLQAGNDPEGNARGDDVAIIQKMAPSVIIFLRFDTAKIPQQSDKLVLFASADFSGKRKVWERGKSKNPVYPTCRSLSVAALCQKRLKDYGESRLSLNLKV